MKFTIIEESVNIDQSIYEEKIMKIEDIELIEVFTHFCKDDKEFMRDYESIDILINGSWGKTYGNWEERGQEMVEGFLDALKTFGAKFELKRVDVADFDC